MTLSLLPVGNKPLDVAQVSNHQVEKLLRLRELSGTSELQLRLLEGRSDALTVSPARTC